MLVGKRVTYAAVALVLGFLVTGSAHATVLYAGPLNTDATLPFLDCMVTNLGPRNPLVVTIDNIDSTGFVYSSQTVFLGILQSEVVLAGPNPFPPGICRFTFNASKNQVRASACASTNGKCDGAALPAVELPDTPR